MTNGTWCAECQEVISDVFEDHFEQHRAAQEPASMIGIDTLAFWAFCIAVGTIAAFVVANG